jgi:hypothetical protein
MADTAIGLLQGDEPSSGQRIGELEHELQIAANILLHISFSLNVWDPRAREASDAANRALRIL